MLNLERIKSYYNQSYQESLQIKYNKQKKENLIFAHQEKIV